MAGIEQGKIAAAAIFCARNVLQISPLWPLNLERLFHLEESTFHHCATLLMSLYVMQDSDQQSNNQLCTPPRKRARMEENSPNDEGYVSRCSIEATPKEMNEEI